MKSALIRVLFLLIGFIFALFVAEWVLRFLNFILPLKKTLDGHKELLLDHLIYSQNLKYKVKPYTSIDCTILHDKNHKATCSQNKLGIRDDEENLEKPSNIYRIIVLGDSMTYGLGVNSNQSYPKMLEKLIQEKNKSPLGYQVINLGMTFYGPREYYYLYEELLRHSFKR